MKSFKAIAIAAGLLTLTSIAFAKENVTSKGEHNVKKIKKL